MSFITNIPLLQLCAAKKKATQIKEWGKMRKKYDVGEKKTQLV